MRLLIKKIISVDDIHKRCLAIDNWFNCAKKLGVTTTLNPKDFLEELLFKFPEAKQNILDQKSLLFYNFEIWPRFFAKRVIDNIVVEMFMRLGDNGMIQGMSNEMVTIDQNFFRGKHHNTEELLDFIDSFKNE